MKKKYILFAWSLLVLYAFKKVNDVLTDVGTTIEEVKQITMKQIAKKDFSLPWYTSQVRNACQRLPAGVREATMMSLGKIVKDYVESPQFSKDYMAYLERPEEPATSGRFGSRSGNAAPKDWNAEKKKRIDQTLRSMSNPQVMDMYVQNLDAQMKLNQDMLDLYKDSPDLKMSKTKEELQEDLAEEKKLKDLYTKDREAFKTKYAEYDAEKQIKNMMDQENKTAQRKAGQQQQQLEQLTERKEQLKDYKSIIRHQLQQFLAASADVDYTAQLKKEADKTVFVNPAYESKPASWKFCFRCGKEAVTGARKFAQEWLRTLK